MLDVVFKRFCADQSGSTAVEYGLIAGLMALASLMAFATLGGGLNNMFSKTSDRIAPLLETP